MEAGFAKVEITPPLGLQIAGTFSPRPIEGVLDPLHAHAAVLKTTETQVVLVSCDLVSLAHGLVAEVRKDVEREMGLPGGNVALFATHTHTGPYTKTLFGNRADGGYVRSLTGRIREAILLANERMEPVEVGAAAAFESTISFNRRYVMKDGLVRTHPKRASSEISHAEGPIDPEIGVLCFRRPGAEVLGCLVNFACHPNVVRGAWISADFPGALGRELERRLGEQCITLFSQGASGNICQIDVLDANKQDSGPEWAGRMGEVLAERTAEALERMSFTAQPRLWTASRTLDMALRNPDQTPYLGTMFGGETWKEVDETYVTQQEELRHRIQECPTVGFEIQAMRIDQAALVMFPAELFVEFGLEMKRRSTLKPTLVVTHANGGFGYVPTRQAFDGGGYETRTGTNSMLVPEAGEQIVEAALEVLSELA